ncbi:MAG: hypothetical protein IKC26_08680 [Clostridia bacterium]|nr:hypothetical protein [Clostridia bacterium]
MKKFISCFFLLVLFCLSSCSGGSGADTPTEPNTPPESSEPAESSSADTTEDETTEEETTEEEPFSFEADPDRTDLPSLDVLYQIQLGMSMREVYEIAGSPHRIVERREPASPTSSSLMNALYYVYDSDGNYSIYIFFSRKTSEPHMGVSRLIRVWKDYTLNE